MAKIRHRTFEIFEFLQEAREAFTSKSARVHTYTLDPDLWRFHRIDAAVDPAGIAHITFKQEAEATGDFGKDLSDLASFLPNGSRVVFDFEGMLEFKPEAIAKLTDFHGKLQNSGSRIVLCNLGVAVHASFFPHHKPKTSPEGT